METHADYGDRMMEGSDTAGYEMLERLNEQIDRYERLVNALTNRVRPVLDNNSTVKMIDGPEEVAYHNFHEKIMAFALRNDELEAIINRIRL